MSDSSTALAGAATIADFTRKNLSHVQQFKNSSFRCGWLEGELHQSREVMRSVMLDIPKRRYGARQQLRSAIESIDRTLLLCIAADAETSTTNPPSKE